MITLAYDSDETMLRIRMDNKYGLVPVISLISAIVNVQLGFFTYSSASLSVKSVISTSILSFKIFSSLFFSFASL